MRTLPRVRDWVVKGKPSRNDFARNVRPGATERWVTRRAPRDWSAGDAVFLWKGAPASCVIAFAEIVAIEKPRQSGDTFFTLRYTSAIFPNPLDIAFLRSESTFAGASFLKAGAAGTVFAISREHADRLEFLAFAKNPALARSKRSDHNVVVAIKPTRALSIRQPWAELIMRGIKTIEARSLPTHVRGPVMVYAGKNRVSDEDEDRVICDFGIDVDALPREVIVGTVDIVGCRKLTVKDSDAAAFPVSSNDDYFAWLLSSPVRAMDLRAPTRHPQPMFFRPF